MEGQANGGRGEGEAMAGNSSRAGNARGTKHNTGQQGIKDGGIGGDACGVGGKGWRQHMGWRAGGR